MKTHRLSQLTLVAASSLALIGVVTFAAPNAIADEGGDGNPLQACPNAETIASAPIHYQGQHVGTVEMRWSWSCGGNWTRTTSHIGVRQLQAHIYRESNSDSRVMAGDVADQNFSYFLHAGPHERMCSYGSVRVNDNAQPAAWFCSD